MPQTEKLANIYLHLIKTGAFLSLFLPILAVEFFVFPFVFPKTIAFRIIVELMLAAYLALAVIKPQYRPQWLVSLKFDNWKKFLSSLLQAGSALPWLLTAFILVLVATAITGADTYHSFWSSYERSEGVITWLHLLVYFIILSAVFKNKTDWLKLFQAAVAAGWLQAIYALAQFFHLPGALDYGGGRIGGALGNASFLASYLIFITFIAAYLASLNPGKKGSWLYYLLIIINIFLLWQTQTRGAILALLAGALFFITIRLFSQSSLKTKLVCLGLIVLAIGLVNLVYVKRSSDWVKSAVTLNRLTNISPTDTTTQNRLIVWSVGWQGFLAHPWLGWGLENFQAPFNRYFDPAITRDLGSQPWYDRAHNTLVEVAVAAGIVGLLLYLAIFFQSVKIILSRKPADRPLPAAKLILVALLIVYFLQNLFVFDTLSSYLMFFLVLAFSQSQLAPPVAGVKKTTAKATVAWLPGIFVPGFLLLASFFLIWLLNIRPALANHHTVLAVTKYKSDIFLSGQNFNKALRYSPPNVQELRFILTQHARDLVGRYGITQGTLPMVQLAIVEMEKSLQAAPEAVQNYLLLAELYLMAAPLDQGYLPRAWELTNKALGKAPARYQIYTMLGRLNMERGQFPQGVDNFERAIALNDKFAEAHWNLAIAHILGGEFEQAAEPLLRAKNLGLVIDSSQNQNRLLSAYRDSHDLLATVNFLKELTQKFPENEDYRQSLIQLDLLYQQVKEAASNSQ